MRNFWTTLALVAVLAAGCWFVFFRASCASGVHAAARTGDTMEWMRCEFHLTEAQLAAIRRLHEEHNVVCARHCEAVGAARRQLAAARQAGDAAAALAATGEMHAAEEVCRASVEAHVRRVAAEMTPAEGERFLRMVLPRIAALDHSGPPALTPEP